MGKVAWLAMAVMAVMTVTATAAGAMTLSVSRDLPGLKFTAQSRLPRAPASARSQKDCDWVLVSPRTEGGRLAAARGWGVTGEAAVGDYTAVSFAGSFTWGTGGVCAIRDGNVGIFKGKALVALLYGAKPAGDIIGSIMALEGGAVRVLTGEDVPYPEGDLRAVFGGFTLGQVAEADPVCGGAATVPNVYGAPIDKARLAVLKDGWRPLPADPSAVPAPGEREHALARAGLPEVQFCAGTGLADCEFGYANAAGKLTLHTIGEDDPPQVTSYAVECRNQAKAAP